MLSALDVEDVDMFHAYTDKITGFVFVASILLCFLIFLIKNSVLGEGSVKTNAENNSNNGRLFDHTLRNNAPLEMKKLSESAVREQQTKAFYAASLQLGVKDIEYPVSSRPEFISPLEWEILQRVSENEEDSEQALVNYINHIRFAKQEELWEQLVDTQEVEKRYALAEQLLSNIPSRVKNNNISVRHAQGLQMKLLSDLVDDPEKRRVRISEEADRIGVTFSVEKTGFKFGG